MTNFHTKDVFILFHFKIKYLMKTNKNKTDKSNTLPKCVITNIKNNIKLSHGRMNRITIL